MVDSRNARNWLYPPIPHFENRFIHWEGIWFFPYLRKRVIERFYRIRRIKPFAKGGAGFMVATIRGNLPFWATLNCQIRVKLWLEINDPLNSKDFGTTYSIGGKVMMDLSFLLPGKAA